MRRTCLPSTVCKSVSNYNRDVMTDIKGSADCGNSPKNKFVQDVAINLELGKIEPQVLSSNAIWHHSGDEPVDGRDAIVREVANRPKPLAITIQHAISHGKVGAVSGELTLENGQNRRFSHVIEFTNAKANCVATITSYA